MGAISALLVFDEVRFAADTLPALDAWARHGTRDARWPALAIGPVEADREALARALPSLGALVGANEALDEHTVDAVGRWILASACGGGIAFGNAKSLVLSLDERVLPHDAAALLQQLDEGLVRPWAPGSGGFGEGLRGALRSADVRRLATAIEALGITSTATDLRGLRSEVGASAEDGPLIAVAGLARLGGTGLVHARDPSLDGFGRWATGVLLREG